MILIIVIFASIRNISLNANLTVRETDLALCFLYLNEYMATTVTDLTLRLELKLFLIAILYPNHKDIYASACEDCHYCNSRNDSGCCDNHLYKTDCQGKFVFK